MALTIAGLALAGLGATAGAIGSAVNRSNARKEANKAYENAQSYLTSEYYRDPLSSIGNRALLKSMDQRLKDSTDAADNRMAASGATMENQLAVRQSNNEVMGNVYNHLLMSEDARRQAISQQKFQLDQNHSAAIQGSYLQAAQDWQSWGAQMGQAGMSVVSAGTLGKK